MSIENLSSLVSGDIWDIPQSWEWVSISQISSIISGGTPSTKVEQYYNGDISWITPADMSTHKGIYIERGRRNISQYGLENSSAQILPKGTVLFSSRAPIGYVAIAANEVATNQGFKSFIPEESISSTFLYYWLIFAKPFAEKLASGTTFLEISGSKSALLPFPLAPEKEQNRIVDKLEELFSELDSGVKELKSAQIKLTQYRQSLLKSAVEGSLTQQWREANSGSINETGAQLLDRILTERRELWEKQKLAEFKAKDKKPPKNWQAKYPEAATPDISDLPELPIGWVWATIDQLAINKRYGSSSKTNDDSSGVPVLRMGNIQDGKLDYGNLKFLPVDHNEFPDLLLNDGDLLFNRTNSAELVGKTAVYRDIGKPVSYASYLISVTFSEHVLPEIAVHYINSVLGKKWLSEVMNQTAGQANVNGTKLGHLAIPLPPSAEQKALIDELSNEFDSVDRQVEATALGLKQSEAQRKNILKSAFSGQLVPQDPNDEPASELLERIKREREELAKQAKPKKTRQPKKKVKLMDTLLEVLTAEDDWIDAQEAFQKSGVRKNTSSDVIEKIYLELRELVNSKQVEVKKVNKADKLRIIKK
ncbi:type I restriction enzyme, S subunit [Vibrio crassostreae]|nr:type I restriction enzyme, S subunit [Vibrio crassostreae]